METEDKTGSLIEVTDLKKYYNKVAIKAARGIRVRQRRNDGNFIVLYLLYL